MVHSDWAFLRLLQKEVVDRLMSAAFPRPPNQRFNLNFTATDLDSCSRKHPLPLHRDMTAALLLLINCLSQNFSAAFFFSLHSFFKESRDKAKFCFGCSLSRLLLLTVDRFCLTLRPGPFSGLTSQIRPQAAALRHITPPRHPFLFHRSAQHACLHIHQLCSSLFFDHFRRNELVSLLFRHAAHFSLQVVLNLDVCLCGAAALASYCVLSKVISGVLHVFLFLQTALFLQQAPRIPRARYGHLPGPFRHRLPIHRRRLCSVLIRSKFSVVGSLIWCLTSPRDQRIALAVFFMLLLAHNC